jgi:hypothetical protein
MAINWKWPGLVWLEHTGENVAIGFSGTVLGAMLASKTQDFAAVDWWHVLNQAGFVSLTFFLTAVVSLKAGRGVGNGTASFNPRVVAGKFTCRHRLGQRGTSS